MSWAQLRHLVEDDRAQMHLHLGGGVVRDHGAEIFEPAAHNHHGGDADEGGDQLVERYALKYAGDQPPE